jgi:hypothetical protein
MAGEPIIACGAVVFVIARLGTGVVVILEVACVESLLPLLGDIAKSARGVLSLTLRAQYDRET